MAGEEKGSVPRRRVLQLRQQLDERLPQTWHNVGRVDGRETTDDLDGDLANDVNLVVESDEEGADAFGLGEVTVELRVEVGDGELTD
jgi:hypothetical protein